MEISKSKTKKERGLSLERSGNVLEERSPTKPDVLSFSCIKHGKQTKEANLVSCIVNHAWDNDRQMGGDLAHRFGLIFDAMF